MNWLRTYQHLFELFQQLFLRHALEGFLNLQEAADISVLPALWWRGTVHSTVRFPAMVLGFVFNLDAKCVELLQLKVQKLSGKWREQNKTETKKPFNLERH